MRCNPNKNIMIAQLINCKPETKNFFKKSGYTVAAMLVFIMYRSLKLITDEHSNFVAV